MVELVKGKLINKPRKAANIREERMGLVRVGDEGDEYFYPSKVTTNGELKSLETIFLQSKPHGARLGIKYVTALSGALSGATANVGTNLITAGMFVIGVVIRVTTLLVGPTTITIGDGTDADKWGASIALAAGTTTTSANWTAGPTLYTSNTNVVLTGTGGSFSAGVVRACVFYLDAAALAS